MPCPSWSELGAGRASASAASRRAVPEAPRTINASAVKRPVSIRQRERRVKMAMRANAHRPPWEQGYNHTPNCITGKSPMRSGSLIQAQRRTRMSSVFTRLSKGRTSARVTLNSTNKFRDPDHFDKLTWRSRLAFALTPPRLRQALALGNRPLPRELPGFCLT